MNEYSQKYAISLVRASPMFVILVLNLPNQGKTDYVSIIQSFYMNLSLYTTGACLLFTVMAGSINSNAGCTSAINAKDTGKTWLALGDSYTIGQSVPYEDNYPEQTMNLLNDSGLHFMHPEIIATTGWTTGDLLNAIADKTVPASSYDIVSLLIGVNNQYQGRTPAEYQTQFTTLLQRSIAYAGNKPSHVIVISIPDYAFTPFGKSTGDGATISYRINAFNAINKQVAQNYGVRYIDVTDMSRKAGNDKGLIATDGLHYSAKEYHLWSEVLATAIQQALLLSVNLQQHNEATFHLILPQ